MDQNEAHPINRGHQVGTSTRHRIAAGQFDGTIGTPPTPPFVLLGDANLDPQRGDGRGEAIAALLSNPPLQDPLPHRPTVNWAQTGPMRVDYILPSRDWEVSDAGLIWPKGESASRHALVWVDLTR